MLLLVSSFGFAQISINQNFDASTTMPTGWTETGAKTIAAAESCAGNSIRDNVYDTSATGTLVTPNQVGLSNGTDLTFAFKYKVEDWNTTTATVAGWGNIQVQYSTNNGTTWTTILTINDSNHVAANTCATKSVTIPGASLPTGSDAKFRFLFTWLAGDWDIYLDDIAINQVSTIAPACTTVTTPAPAATNVAIASSITWTQATGIPTGYRVTAGTSPGANNIANNIDVGNVTTYSLGTLAYSTTYYVTVTPYNAVGAASGCTETSFTTISAPPVGSTCAAPINITGLPYTITDDTANYRDIIDGSPGATGCTTTSSYLNGNEVVYAYTATFTGSIKIVLTPTAANSGIFVYSNCANIGNSCLAGAASTGTAVRTISQFPVTAGQTYYFVISTNATPQTTAYTLDITENACTSPTATYAVVSNCANAPQFFVDLTLTNLGSATTLYAYDDQAGDVQEITAIGTYRFGPYALATPVVITTENGQNATCSLTSTALTLTFCPPVNDECSNAIALTVNADFACGAATAGATNGATASAQADDVSGTPNNDVWYRFVATGTAHRISLTNIVATAGTSVDMGIGVYNGTGGCGALVLTGSSDPETYNVTGLTAGTTYYVRIYGWGADANNFNTFNICVGTPPPPPANDDCANAELLVPSATTTCGTSVSGTTISATQSLAGCSGTANDDVWYKFVATATAHTIVTTNVSGATDIVTQVFNSCGGTSLVCQDTPDSPVNLVGLTVGNTYFFRIYTYTATADTRTSFTVCVTTSPPAPANDLIAGAATLTESPTSTCANSVAGTTISASHSSDYACSTTDADVWYTFTPTTTTIYSFSRTVVSGTGNGYISIYSGAPGSLTRLNANCTSTSFNQALTAGTQYYVSVSSTVASTLSFALCVYQSPPPPANDLIANAAVLTESPTSACANGLAGTTVSATHSSDYACSATDIDVWYTFSPATTGVYFFRRTVVSGTGNGYISIYTGTPGSLTRVNTSCSSTTFNLALTAGTNYYVSVSSTATSALTYTLCAYPAPPAPANDSCTGAIVLTAGSVFATNPLQGTTTSATRNTADPIPTCDESGFATSGSDVWYSVIAPASGTLTAETGTVLGTALTDTGLQAYRGTCAALVSILCNADDGDGNYSKVVMTGLTAGETVLLRVWGYNGTSGDFQISAYDASLSAPSFDNASFRAYPNPVKDILTLSYTQDMTNVSVFNLVGQQVINKSLNATEANVDMSNLSAGTYLVKVTVDNQVKTIKVVKQ